MCGFTFTGFTSKCGPCSPSLCISACAVPMPGPPSSGPFPPAGDFLRPYMAQPHGLSPEASPDPPWRSPCLSQRPHTTQSPYHLCRSSHCTDPVLSLRPLVSPEFCLPAPLAWEPREGGVSI